MILLTKRISLFLMLIFFFTHCDKDSTEKKQEDKEIVERNISGSVQKGPYLNGTNITIAELDNSLNSTGRNFNTSIVDNTGFFEMTSVELASPYIEVFANGFYFNEVTGANSNAQLSLDCITNLDNASAVNVNLLSTLEKERVKYLLTSESKTFAEAKSQAQNEILSIFEIDISNIDNSENLDITGSGAGDAALLAVSLILQGRLSEANLSELIANLSSDLKTDGELDSDALGTQLINNAKSLGLADIRNNLEERLEELELTVNVPNFEEHIEHYVENTDAVFNAFIEYPETGTHGLNLLHGDRVNYPEGEYSMRAIIPDDFKLEVTVSGFHWEFDTTQQNTGWDFDVNFLSPFSQSVGVFTSIETGDVDLSFQLIESRDSAAMYYENVRIIAKETFNGEPKGGVNKNITSFFE